MYNTYGLWLQATLDSNLPPKFMFQCVKSLEGDDITTVNHSLA